MDMKNAKAAITGGVSGLGFSVAQRIVADGGRVAMLDINDEKGAKAVAELGDSARYFNTDVRSESAVRETLAQASEFLGGLNVAVSCAGIIGAGRAVGRDGPMDLDFFANVIQINLIGTFNMAKEAAALMQSNDPGEDGERGVIINTASVAAYEGQIGQGAYSASKGGVVGMTLPLAREFTRAGIRVLTIAPGIFWTPMVDGMPQEIQDALGASIPFPSRLGQPEEFADTCAFIIGNRYMNGETIRIDGAVRLTPK
jgi:NAD(P)-dependent dehydrogenase (short-subunit alcohol dehydrogenase family)